jgi:hypothetical protein
MARANFVKKARKDVPGTDIKAGESYYWWQLYRSPKRYSRTRPRASQLTGSAFLQQYYGFQEELEDMTAEDMDDLQGQMEDLAGRMRELAEECEGNRDNMPEGLQDSDTGQLLEERAEGMNGWADELESFDFEFEPDLDFSDIDEDDALDAEEKEAAKKPIIDEAIQERIQELIDDAQSADPGLS